MIRTHHYKSNSFNRFISALSVLLLCVTWTTDCRAVGRTSISGSVTFNGNPVCAVVLANGKHQFACAGDGRFDLTDVPLDSNNEIILYAFCSGLSPYKTTLSEGAADVEIELTADSEAEKPVVTIQSRTDSIRKPGWIDISGTIKNKGGSLLCAMVLANGQYMFTCDPIGEFNLTVPLDANGEITLFGFSNGLMPYQEVIEYGSDDPGDMLKSAQTWMYQIQDLDVDGAVAALKASDYPLLVIEPGHNFTDSPYDTATMVNALRTTAEGNGRRLVVAYVDIGQAEDYRDYWGADWVAPTETRAGSPDFLITIDPDGWSGNYPVAYWKSEWKAIWLGESGIVAQLAKYGFDGIYLDWVEAYDDEKVIAAATADNVDPALEMILFVEELGQAGRAVSEDFLVIPQNAPYLIDVAPDRYASAIDALAVEDTWYHGAGDADWDDPDAGDLQERHEDEWSTENRLKQYEKYQNLGLPVFSVDYCISATNANTVYTEAANAGLVPLVTRVSLSRMTETPPPTPASKNAD